ncbi:MAG: WYL domain-containing protein [Campylobacter sp.]|nr:WYL domain-containing protein [Campylobacter sp.]
MLPLKQVENKKNKRLNQIFEFIKSRPAKTQELAQIFGVNAKTIGRDMEILRDYGVVKEGWSWKYDPSAQMRDLSDEERLVLSLIASLCENISSDFYFKNSELISGLLGGMDEQILAFFGNEKLDKKSIQKFSLVQKAIKNKNIIKCTYGKREFKAKPIKIAFLEGFWYLFVFDCGEGDRFKKFHFKDIENIKITPEVFKISAQVQKRIKQARSVWFELEDKYRARLWIDEVIAKYFRRKPYINCDFTKECEDGSIEIEFGFSNPMEVKPLIYRFLPHIKVVEPAWLNDEIKAQIAGYIGEIS